MVIRGLLKKKKPIISYAFCHSTEKNNHRGKSCWTRLRRSWRPGCQEKLGNLVRLRWSLSKWPWHSFFSSSLKCGLDGFTRDLPNTSSCPHVYILWNWRYGLKAKFLPQAACFLSIFAFSACHKITVIIFFFLSEHVMITHPVAGEVFLRRAAVQELSLALVPCLEKAWPQRSQHLVGPDWEVEKLTLWRQRGSGQAGTASSSGPSSLCAEMSSAPLD